MRTLFSLLSTRRFTLGAGGSRAKAASVLARLHALAEAEAELAAHAAALQGAEAALQARARAADEHRRHATARFCRPDCAWPCVHGG